MNANDASAAREFISVTECAQRFPNTRVDALARLREFLPRVPCYAADRNHLVRGHENVSRLSPAIRHRLLLEEEVATAALDAHGLGAAEKFVQEIWWRRYWKVWLQQRPSVWRSWVERRHFVRKELSPAAARRMAEVEAAASGVAVMDEFVRELTGSGWMHNHARMWFASYWIHIERLPWELGAEFFFRHLLDADAASNTLSWRWVAGLHTRGKTYLVSRANIEKYLNVKDWGGERGLNRIGDRNVVTNVPSDDADAQVERECALKFPQNVAQPFGLWIHEEDLLPERSACGALDPALILATFDSRCAREFDTSPLQRAYKLRALDDAVARARAHPRWGTAQAAGPIESDDLAESLLTASRQHDLRAIVALKPFRGPLLDAVEVAGRRLAANGVELHLLRRADDAELLESVTGGYFPFWQRIRSSLARSGRP